MANVLIASLGESPIVVTAMYDLLTTEEKQRELGKIGKVVVLHPYGGDVPLGYDLVAEALKGKCELEPLMLSFKDTDDEQTSFTFLQMLVQLLSIHQKNGDRVYLSLAGGRKSMSALMAMVVPLFPCVKKLYHVLDKYEDNFLLVEDLFSKLSEDERALAMYPEHSRLNLMSIPFGDYQYVSDEFRSRLFTITDEELDDLWDENPELAETTEFYRPSSQPQAIKSVLNVEVTARVQKEYKRISDHNAPQAKRFAVCFKQMKNPYRLFETLKGRGFSRDSLSFHIYKRRRTVERVFYHTEPQSIHLFPNATVETVVISGLAVEQPDGSYKPTAKEMLTYDVKPRVSIDTLFSSTESILIVPLGKLPMVATQLYTLLKSEGRNIREVVLIYPELSRDVRASAKLVMDAFEYENEEVTCWEAPVLTLKDVNSQDACVKYQQALEETIRKVREKHPDWQIELALSGGRKGMAALAMFVAQKMGIRYVYHTLIKGEELNRKIERETKVAVLDELKGDKQLRNNRLFLREYETKGEGPYTKFVLFKVPVLPVGSES